MIFHHYTSPNALAPSAIVQEIFSTMTVGSPFFTPSFFGSINASVSNTPVLIATSTASTTSSIASSTDKLVALTFDDGPYGTSTAAILSILESEHAKATFFLIGRNAVKYPDLVRRIYNDGDDIGNHSYGHLRTFANETKKEFAHDVDAAEAAISNALGDTVHPTLYRPPYGSVSEDMKQVLAKKGYTVVMWNIDTDDWDAERVTTGMIIDGILSNVTPNSIVLLHDGRDTHIDYPRTNTVNAIKPLIEGLRAKGYRLVTITELLAHTGTAGNFVH